MQLNFAMNILPINGSELSDYSTKILGEFGYLFECTTSAFKKNSDLPDGPVSKIGNEKFCFIPQAHINWRMIV